jgi:hypothetical protein
MVGATMAQRTSRPGYEGTVLRARAHGYGWACSRICVAAQITPLGATKAAAPTPIHRSDQPQFARRDFRFEVAAQREQVGLCRQLRQVELARLADRVGHTCLLEAARNA